MNVAILIECGRQGLEAIVLPRICELLVDEYQVELTVEIVPMTDKGTLLRDCGLVARNLLNGETERVLVVWDERPKWKELIELCWHRERLQALAALQQAGITENVYLVCIEREFESWLMFDHPMLSRVLSRPTHKVKFPRQQRPDRNKDPKGTMISKFRELIGKGYVDVEYAARIASELTSLNKFSKCQTFKRFAQKIADLEL